MADVGVMALLRPLLLAAVVAALLVPSSAAARDFNWSGYDWWVREQPLSEPGPNVWSGSTSSVWVDRKGYLHLKVRYDRVQKRWVSAEIGSHWWFGPGRYSWVVESPGDALDRNVTLGMYNYLDATHEIDVELARWGQTAAQDPTNAQYAVQPWYVDGNQVRFEAPSGVTTYSFDWRPDSISFNGASGSWLQPWLYTGLNVSGDWMAPVRINLWQFEGRPPASNKPVEVVLRSFRYESPPAG